MEFKTPSDAKNPIYGLTKEEIYLWYANNSREILGAMCAIELLNYKDNKIHGINVSEITYNKGKVINSLQKLLMK